MSRFLLSLLLLFTLTGCAPHHRHHTHAKHHATKPVKVKHLSDGRVVYRDDNGMFWFYMYMMQSNSATSAAYTSNGRSFDYYETPTLSNTLPSGGAWVPAAQLPAQTEIQLEFELNDPRVTVAEVAVETDAQGGMIETNEVQTEFDFNETTTESDTNASDSDTSGPDSSSDSSSSGDSSGGGDSGGSSGGDSGGGGGDSGGSSGD